jgi:hypothetical protein
MIRQAVLLLILSLNIADGATVNWNTNLSVTLSNYIIRYGAFHIVGGFLSRSGDG